MPLIIPDINNASLRRLVACGWLEKSDPSVAERIEKLKCRKLAQVWDDARLNQRILRLIIDRGPTDNPQNHFHVDISVPTNSKRPPQINSTEQEICEVAAGFFGLKATIFVRGIYSIPWNELPHDGMIRLTQATAQMAGANISQKSAKFEITGAGSLREIKWELEDDDDETTSIEIGLFLTETISNDYLLRLYPLVDDAWRRLVLDENKEGA